MKLKKSAIFAVAAVTALWAGAAFADTLISTTYHSDGSSTQVWVSSSGSVYTKSCNAAGACSSSDWRKEN
ncbi:MAG: hypothetical protein ACREO0_07260 [Pseudoxanthomonas sp.]